MNYNITKGNYLELAPAIKSIKTFSPTENVGYLYCFDTKNEPNRIKAGQTSNLYRRLYGHNTKFKEYSNDEINNLIVVGPIHDLRKMESGLLHKLGKTYEPARITESFYAPLSAVETLIQKVYDKGLFEFFNGNYEFKEEIAEERFAQILSNWFRLNKDNRFKWETLVGQSLVKSSEMLNEICGPKVV